jgi:ABC-type transport system involved in multi-copper enzyme maturation permease subunit
MRTIPVLLKKDITLDMSNILIVIIISLGIPIYSTYAFGEMGMNKGMDFISLFLSSFYCFFLSFGKLGIIEHKYRGTAYLTLTPVTRRDIVLSKYVYSIFVFLISVVGYEIAYLIIPSMQLLSYSSVIIVCAADILLLSIYIPLEFKVGYENVKYYFTAVIVFSPFLIGIIGKYNGLSIFQAFIEAGSNLLPFIIAFSLITIMVSYSFSVRIFEKKDL